MPTRPTYDEWTAYFPMGTFPDFTQTQYEIFEDILDIYVPINGSYPSDNYFAQLYVHCMAHLAWEWEAVVKGDDTSDAGPIKSARIDKIHVQYQGGTVTNEYESWFGQSRYGRIFLNLQYNLRKDDITQLYVVGVA